MHAFGPSGAVIFDLDGTLVDSLPGITAAICYALRIYGVEIGADQVRGLIGPPIKDVLRRLAASLQEPELVAAEREFRSAYDTRNWKETYLFSSTRETLESLRQLGVRLFLFTNKPEKAATRILDELDLTGLFQDRLSRDSQQPAFANKTEMLRELFRRHGLEAENALVVGDSSEDFHAAQELGVPFVFAKYGYGQLGNSDREKTAVQIDSLSSLLALS